MTVAAQKFVGLLVIVVQMYLPNLVATCSQESVAFDVEAFVAVQAVVLFEVLISAGVVVVGAFLVLVREQDEFRLTIVDGFDLASALSQGLASLHLVE